MRCQRLAGTPKGQVIVRNDHGVFERLDGVLRREGQISAFVLWTTQSGGKPHACDNSLPSDSDRFLAVGSVTQSDQLAVELVADRHRSREADGERCRDRMRLGHRAKLSWPRRAAGL
jgi:hypothetical protein